MRHVSVTRRRRFTLAVAVALIIGLVWVVAAAADAPDPVDVNNKTVPAIPTASATVKVCGQVGGPTTTQCAAHPNAVKVTIKGGWTWTTHGSSCTDDRAGVGYAVSWADAGQPGNPVKSGVPTGGGGSTNVAVGALAGNDLNPIDNVVHPTHNSATGDDTGVVDPATPTQTVVVGGKTLPAWRGGCGQAPSGNYTTGTYSGTPLNTHGVGSGTQNGVNQGNLPRGLWGPISHVYAQSSDIGTICTITYDVHKGTDPDHNGGVGIPSGSGEVTAGGSSRNPDNGAEKNSGTPLGNACPAIIIPQPSIRVTKQPSVQTVSFGGTARWTITVINNGAIDLSNIQVSDTQAPASCAGALTSLAPTASTGWDPSGNGTLSVGASVSYQCHLDNVVAAFTNVVTACANGTGPPCDSDTTDVTQQGAVGIESMATNQDIVPNDRVSLGIDDPGTTAIDGALSPAGSFSFEFWQGACDATGSTKLYSTPSAITGTTDGLNYRAATSNTQKLSDMLAAGADTSGTYYWKVSYSGDTYTDGTQKNEAFSRCTETLTIAN